MYKSTPSLESIEGRVEKWVEQIKKLELDIRNRDENKEVALGTSKINYMDPRISVAWCKRCDVPIDKVFAKTLRDKFNWYVILPQLLLVCRLQLAYCRFPFLFLSPYRSSFKGQWLFHQTGSLNSLPTYICLSGQRMKEKFSQRNDFFPFYM